MVTRNYQSGKWDCSKFKTAYEITPYFINSGIHQFANQSACLGMHHYRLHIEEPAATSSAC
jgi:hypothetical protein